jgi:aryl-alcohol dehydrogenase-like predicted oxidoreductase
MMDSVSENLHSSGFNETLRTADGFLIPNPLFGAGGYFMQKRDFGRTGHKSSVAIFGAAAFWELTQAEADRAMEQVIAYEVNHIDVAPSYGQAEERLSPWLRRERQRFFVGCKTMERSRDGAMEEMHRSLKRLQTDTFDLYQIHAITSMAELDEATSKGGALEAIIDARQAGLTRFIGITGHGVDSPLVFIEALRRFDFDSVLFPLNFIQYADPTYRENATKLLALCQERQIGVMIIKSITRGPWGSQPETHTTWYQPFSEREQIQQAVNFVLSQPVTGLCTVGDTSLLPVVLQACEEFRPMNQDEQELLIHSASQFEPLFV